MQTYFKIVAVLWAAVLVILLLAREAILYSFQPPPWSRGAPQWAQVLLNATLQSVPPLLLALLLGAAWKLIRTLR